MATTRKATVIKLPTAKQPAAVASAQASGNGLLSQIFVGVVVGLIVIAIQDSRRPRRRR